MKVATLRMRRHEGERSEERGAAPAASASLQKQGGKSPGTKSDAHTTKKDTEGKADIKRNMGHRYGNPGAQTASPCQLKDGAVGTLEERETSLCVRMAQRNPTWWGQSSHQTARDSMEAVVAQRWPDHGRTESRFVENVVIPTWWWIL